MLSVIIYRNIKNKRNIILIIKGEMILENYNEFLDRINSFEKLNFSLEQKFFTPDLSIKSKVNEKNEFENFYGDTVVFDLDEKTKNRIGNIIEIMYKEVPQCFCEKRVTDTLHMTLHDLTSSIEKGKIEHEMDNNLNKLKELLKNNPILDEKIKMRTNFITDFGHVNLVLALCPISEEEYKKIMQIRNVIDSVKELDYKFSPHITLAYFNRNGFDIESVNKLTNAVRKLNSECDFDVILDTKQIFYQRFKNMNCYENLYKFIK